MDKIINDDDISVPDFVKTLIKNAQKDSEEAIRKYSEEVTRIKSITENISFKRLLVIFSLIIKEALGATRIELLNRGMDEEVALMYTKGFTTYCANYFKQKITESIDDYMKEKPEFVKNLQNEADNIPLKPLLVIFSVIIKEKLGKNTNEWLNQGVCEEETLRYLRDDISYCAEYFKQIIDDYVKEKDEVSE